MKYKHLLKAKPSEIGLADCEQVNVMIKQFNVQHLAF